MWAVAAYVATTGLTASLAKKSPHILLDGCGSFGIADMHGDGAMRRDERGYPHCLWTSLRTAMWIRCCTPCAASVARSLDRNWPRKTFDLRRRLRIASSRFWPSSTRLSTQLVHKPADSDGGIVPSALPRKLRSKFGQKLTTEITDVRVDFGVYTCAIHTPCGQARGQRCAHRVASLVQQGVAGIDQNIARRCVIPRRATLASTARFSPAASPATRRRSTPSVHPRWPRRHARAAASRHAARR